MTKLREILENEAQTRSLDYISRLGDVAAALKKYVEYVDKEYKTEKAALLAELRDKEELRKAVQSVYSRFREYATQIFANEWRQTGEKTFGNVKVRVKKVLRPYNPDEIAHMFEDVVFAGTPVVVYRPQVNEKALLEYLDYALKAGYMTPEEYDQYVEYVPNVAFSVGDTDIEVGWDDIEYLNEWIEKNLKVEKEDKDGERSED